MSQELVYKN